MKRLSEIHKLQILSRRYRGERKWKAANRCEVLLSKLMPAQLKTENRRVRAC